jgi:hypothetical protein
VPNVSDVRQIEAHTAEPLVPGPSHLEVEIAITKLKQYKLPSSDQILAELFQAGGKKITVCNLQTWEMIRENIRISAKESLHYFELKRHKPGSMKYAQNY